MIGRGKARVLPARRLAIMNDARGGEQIMAAIL
jgi:hypothetical protein